MDERELHIERAKKALASARLLRDGGFVEDAFSRGYYALLHLGLAMLLEVGESLPKTHSGLVAKLYASLSKIPIGQADLKKISRFQALRESGDYAPLSAVTKHDLDEIVGFVERILPLVSGELK